MSDIKVNTISGLGTGGIKILSPVGLSANSPVSGLAVQGKISVGSSAEVVTVAGENFGVNIKAYNTTYTPSKISTLEFTNKNGAYRNKITAEADNSLYLRSAAPNNPYGVTGINFSAGGTSGTFSWGEGNQYLASVIKSLNFSDAVFEEPCEFTGNSNNDYFFGGQGSSSIPPKCTGVATDHDHLINLDLLNETILGPTTLKTWSVFGSLQNTGVKWGQHVSGNFFRKLFNWKRVTCCCGCAQTPGALNPGVYNQVLQGTWIVVGFSVGQRNCSCSDNEQVNFPIDDAAVWTITNSTIKSTISSHLSGTYNLFGFALKPLYNIDNCYYDANGEFICL
jgi:hypothetical protein